MRFAIMLVAAGALASQGNPVSVAQAKLDAAAIEKTIGKAGQRLRARFWCCRVSRGSEGATTGPAYARASARLAVAR